MLLKREDLEKIVEKFWTGKLENISRLDSRKVIGFKGAFGFFEVTFLYELVRHKVTDQKKTPPQREVFFFLRRKDG